MNLPLKEKHETPQSLAVAVAAYEHGRFDEAFGLFGALAEAGNVHAQAWLGALYTNGEGVAADLAAGFVWYLLAAQNGHAQSQTNVGAMLLSGQGVAADIAEGVRWTTMAAEQGDAMAQSNLASLYAKGKGVEKDEAAATHWYLRAAEQGHFPSQARAGFMYANGSGIEKDRVQAFAWLSLAAQHGVGMALSALEAVIAEMSAEEKRAGASLFHQWRNRHAAVSSPARLVPVPG